MNIYDQMIAKHGWLSWLILIWDWVSSHIKPTRILLNLSLILALAASLHHVAYAFSSVNGGSLVAGYTSAIALDVGLISLAIGIKTRKGQGRSLSLLWLGVAGFTLVSVYANWLSGISHLVAIDANAGSFGNWLVWLRPILLSGVIPILAVYLSEIVSGDREIDEKIAQKQERKRIKRLSFEANDTTTNELLSQANDTRQSNIAQRRDRVNELIGAGMSQTDIADELSVSLATVKRDTKHLNNGNGVNQ